VHRTVSVPRSTSCVAAACGGRALAALRDDRRRDDFVVRRAGDRRAELPDRLPRRARSGARRVACNGGGKGMSIGRIAPRAACVALLLALGACSTPKGVRAPSGDDSTIGRGAGSAARGGGYYLDDGPGHLSPAEVLSVPDAVPRPEPVLARTSRPYTVFGRTYRPMNALVPYRERGIASWYGRRYHGRPTSSGEPYDMYAMTAAHPTLPIPSYVRVTRLSNGRSV